VAYYPDPEELIGRLVVVVCNMKKSKLKGVVSQGMVLCAEAVEGETVELLEPHPASFPGDPIAAHGIERAPVKNLKTAHLNEVFGCGRLETRAEDGVATFNGIPLVNVYGAFATVEAPTLRGASIR